MQLYEIWIKGEATWLATTSNELHRVAIEFLPPPSSLGLPFKTKGAHTICLCSRLLFYTKCTGFTVCITYTDISLTLHINQWKINVELPNICGIWSVLLPQSVFFLRFWRSLSSLLTVPYNRRTREESLFWNGSSARAIFPLQIALLRFQTSQQRGRKIHASPRTFRSKIHPKGSELALEEN